MSQDSAARGGPVLAKAQVPDSHMCWACFADPAPVTSFHCEVVPKEPTLILKWARPPGTNVGFRLEISRGAWRNVTDLGSCTSENGTEYRTEVTYLNYSTSYNISITASFCNKTASPAQNTCLTGITGGLCGGGGSWGGRWHRGYPWRTPTQWVCKCGLEICISF